MIVVCDITACPFCDKNGFCTSRVLKITQNGVCKRLTRPTWQEPVQEFEKEPINLLNLVKHEDTPEQIENKEE